MNSQDKKLVVRFSKFSVLNLLVAFFSGILVRIPLVKLTNREDSLVDNGEVLQVQKHFVEDLMLSNLEGGEVDGPEHVLFQLLAD